MARLSVLRVVLFGLISAMMVPPAAAEAIFPFASQIGLAPLPGMVASTSFPGFEDRENETFIRLVSMPASAFGEIEKTMTNEGLRKQGMQVQRREYLALPNGRALFLYARQDEAKLRKWLLIAPFPDLTALVSLEMPYKVGPRFTEPAIRAALATVTVRATVPDEEKLGLLPFRLGDLATLRIARVVPSVAVQLTDGPQNSLEAYEQAHLLVSAGYGGPQQPRDRDHFARITLSGMPTLKEVRIISAEPMRIGGQAGHEIRAAGKVPQTDAEIQIVQWLRFGSGAYLRLLGIAPKEKWNENYTRFRAVRDALETR